jgi:hypothetical protein
MQATDVAPLLIVTATQLIHRVQCVDHGINADMAGVHVTPETESRGGLVADPSYAEDCTGFFSTGVCPKDEFSTWTSDCSK